MYIAGGELALPVSTLRVRIVFQPREGAAHLQVQRHVAPIAAEAREDELQLQLSRGAVRCLVLDVQGRQEPTVSKAALIEPGLHVERIVVELSAGLSHHCEARLDGKV